jgi:hypothetical protein
MTHLLTHVDALTEALYLALIGTAEQSERAVNVAQQLAATMSREDVASAQARARLKCEGDADRELSD